MFTLFFQHIISLWHWIHCGHGLQKRLIRTAGVALGVLVFISMALPLSAREQVSSEHLLFQEKQHLPFYPGERLLYQVYYNWGFVWIHAGTVDFAADTCRWNHRPARHFVSTGRSLTSYDWVFKVRDRYEAWASRGELLPLEFIRDTYEGGTQCYNHYLFDYNRRQITGKVLRTKKKEVKLAIPMVRDLTDVLTAAYRLRTLDVATLAPSDTIHLSLAIDDEVHRVKVVFHGEETITTRGKKSYRCLKFTTSVVAGSIFKSNETISVWVTNDSSHIPVLVEAQILVGSVKVVLHP